jgi:hypothetical protein
VYMKTSLLLYMYHEIIILQSGFGIAGVLQNDRAEHLYELIDAGKVEST